MEGGLTFTIGKGFGRMLTNIAWEKLTDKLNPREAVELITKSLPGCTEGMAVDILDGKIILREDELTRRRFWENLVPAEDSMTGSENSASIWRRKRRSGLMASKGSADYRGRWRQV